ncbi:hypothetical protein GCM10010365_65380 [Streptomyces poonensis]|uniref:Uncharacterized protein n=1 Tax=Streptomyces poonensis TaxID=68255 RepID=A0A918Q7U9_9ACTN|nr:hypothetical protein GCM10010365_65380 [Streptomyces poonensis]GLJ89599.1 hypothetical protein GCM10017589_21990 [Streptomyces poonensis]
MPSGVLLGCCTGSGEGPVDDGFTGGGAFLGRRVSAGCPESRKSRSDGPDRQMTVRTVRQMTVQAAPFSVKAAGSALLPVWLA